MAARTPLPILGAAPSLDALPPLPAGTAPVCMDHLLRERAIRKPFDAAAEAFVAQPGPAERAPSLLRIIAEEATRNASALSLAIGMPAFVAAGLLMAGFAFAHRYGIV